MLADQQTLCWPLVALLPAGLINTLRLPATHLYTVCRAPSPPVCVRAHTRTHTRTHTHTPHTHSRSSTLRWDISLWEFKNALNKLESAELHYRAPEPVEAKLHKVGKAMPKGREQWHLSRTIKDEEATMLFRMFDLNGDGRIQASEMITVFAVFAKADTEEDKKERARLLFRIWDQDGDGEITRKEMREGYKKMNAHAGKGIAGRTLTSVFFHFADKNGDGKISEQEFVDDPKLVDRVMFAMTNSHYQKFLNKEDFPELARCLTESYHELRK